MGLMFFNTNVPLAAEHGTGTNESRLSAVLKCSGGPWLPAAGLEVLVPHATAEEY